MGVLLTKTTAGNATPESLELSFFTAKYGYTALKRLELLFNPKKQNAVHIKDVGLDFEVRASILVEQMLEKMRFVSWLGPEHRNLNNITNILSSYNLSLTVEDSDLSISVLSYGKKIFDMYGRRCSFRWRKLNRPLQGWTRKHKLRLFAKVRAKRDRDTGAAPHARIRKIREEHVRKTLSSRALTLAKSHNSGIFALCGNIEVHMNLVVPHPHAFMETGNNDPRHA